MKAKKVCILIPKIDEQSPIKVAINQKVGLEQRGYRVYVVTINDIFNNWTSFKNVLFSDFLISHCFIANFISWPFRLAGVKTLAMVHTNISLDLKDKYPKTNFLLWRVWKTIIRLHNHILALNPENLKIIGLNVNNRSSIIPNGYDNSRSSIDAPIDINVMEFITDPNYICLVSACVVRHVKRLDKVILSLKNQAKLRYLIIGDGPELDSLKDLVHKHSLNDQVRFLGYTTNPNKYIHKADIAIFPSDSEGFPLALIEAMALGIPCITSDISAFHYFFGDEIVRFNESNYEKDIVDKVNFVMWNKEQLSEMVLNKYLDCFTVFKSTKYIDLVLKRL